MKILFVTWDSPKATYLEGLFLPIFERLARQGFYFRVLQFTWGDSNRRTAIQRQCEQLGVGYRSVKVLRTPRTLGALLTVLLGAQVIRREVREHQIDAVMPRSILPAMATLIAARGRRLPVIFHADGLALDERVEFEGQSPSSLAHRLLRDVEAEAVRRAVVVIQLNERGCQVLADRAGAGVERGKFRIVHNGRDVEQFRPASKLERLKIRRDLGIALDAPLVVYAGTLGPQYCPDEMLEIFSGIYERRANARFLVLTAFKDILEHALGRRPELRGAVFVKYVEISEVPCYVGSSDLALAIILPSFSRQAADAIKIGEYLLCGVPVVATDVGRASLITSEVGLLLHTMDQSELATVTDWFLDNVLPNRTSFSRKCRDVGLMHFSLESAVSAYAEAVAPIITRPDPH